MVSALTLRLEVENRLSSAEYVAVDLHLSLLFFLPSSVWLIDRDGADIAFSTMERAQTCELPSCMCAETLKAVLA